MKAVFVAGTDTGVGKTIVTGCLARFLLEEGLNPVTQKWVQTGCVKPFLKDISLHLKIMGRDRKDIRRYRDAVMPYIFDFPGSPHLASKIQHRIINCEKIKQAFQELCFNFDFVIVEGTGGLLVPFSSKGLLIDIAGDLGLPVLLVAENRLGAINQTLLSIEALKARGIEVLGVIFNNLRKYDKKILEDNPHIIKSLTGVRIFGTLHNGRTVEDIYRQFLPIAKKIFRLLA